MLSKNSQRTLLLPLVVWALAGCPASPTDPPPDPKPDAGPGPGTDAGTVSACASGEINPGPSPLRRLTRGQYDNAVRDLLGIDSNPAQSFLPDAVAFGFDNNAEAQSVTLALVEQHIAAAEAISQLITDDAVRLREVLPCDPVEIGIDECGAAFIDHLARRAYRRPPTPEDRVRLGAVFAAGSESGFRSGIRLVIQAVLLSPHFLYRLEFGNLEDGGEIVPLTDHEIAARLSFFLWNSIPDEALLNSADRGELRTTPQIRAAAQRLLNDPRARAAVSDFGKQWLEIQGLPELTKDPATHPGFSANTAAAMYSGSLRFIEHVVLDADDGTLGELFSAKYAFVSAETAPLVGASASGSQLTKVDVDPTRRSGLFTDLGLLSTHAKFNQSSPVLRGKFVRERIMCMQLLPPPDNVSIEVPDVDPNVPTRERFAQHSTDPACSGCHALMDPLGFGFEHFDAVGAFREMDGGEFVDATGEVKAWVDGDTTFDGVQELATLFGDSPSIRACAATQWFRYAFGRPEVQGEDECSLEQMLGTPGEPQKIREMLVALTLTDAFRHRRPHQLTTECE